MSLINLCCVPSASPQIENGKLSDHEHTSTMDHLRLLLSMVLSLTRTRTDAATGSGEWQEDSGVGLYRAPEEDARPRAAAAPSQSVDLEKKVSLSRRTALF